MARLDAELTPEQVNQVKDGMTDDLMPNIVKRYDELLPNLTAEQQADVRADLLEAREYALDAGSAEECRAWFDKYRGQINSRLAAAGRDMTQVENN